MTLTDSHHDLPIAPNRRRDTPVSDRRDAMWVTTSPMCTPTEAGSTSRGCWIGTRDDAWPEPWAHADHASAPDGAQHEPQRQLLRQRGHGKLLEQSEAGAGASGSLRHPGGAKATVFEWVDIFYNRERFHGTPDYMSPADFGQS